MNDQSTYLRELTTGSDWDKPSKGTCEKLTAAASHIDALEAACKRVLPLIEASGREEVTDTRDWDEAEAMIRAAIGRPT